jgi:hypothetical protein
MCSANVTTFINKTKDVVEQLYGANVTQDFPNYAEFWIRFIGDPKKEKPGAYGLLYDIQFDNDKKEKIDKVYNEVCMAHYSLFCHLAGAHFQSEQLENILKLADSKDKIFQHWETFEIAYFHLGSVFYQVYHLWDLLFLLKGEVTRHNHRFRPSITEKLKNYLELKGQNALFEEVDKTTEDIRDIRDSIVHFSRTASLYLNGEFLIPFNLKQTIWSEQAKEGKWLETYRKTKSDLRKTEKVINTMHDYLIIEYEDFLKSKQIQINYGE